MSDYKDFGALLQPRMVRWAQRRLDFGDHVGGAGLFLESMGI